MKKLIKDNRKYILIFIGITGIAFILRMISINFESRDYTQYITNWLEQMTKEGGIQNYRGNYNLPYIVILAILAHLPWKSLYIVKAVSIIFDYILAISLAVLVYQLKRDKKCFLSAYAITSFTPTVILNSSCWGQCDSIYVSFVIISFIFLIDKKYKRALLFAGIAMAFKFQAALILPLYIFIWSRDKRRRWYYLAIVPFTILVIFLLLSIGTLGGDYIGMAFKQVSKTISKTSLNFPGVYNWFAKANRMNRIDEWHGFLIIIMMIGLGISLLAMLIYMNKKKVIFTPKLIIETGLWSIVLCTFLLPNMHERYLYIGEMLSVVYAFAYGIKNIYVPILLNISSALCYCVYLFSVNVIEIKYITCLNFIVLVNLTIHLIKHIKNAEGEKLTERNRLLYNKSE